MTESRQLATVQVNPFRAERFVHEWTPGDTVQDILKAVQPNQELWRGAHVFLGDIEVNPEYFHVIRPHPGVQITVKILPQGDGILRAVAFIALAVAAAYTGGAAFGAAGGFGAGAAGGALGVSITGAVLVQTAVFVAGSLLINAIIPIDAPSLDNGDDNSQALSVGGARNRLNPFGVLPTILGFYRFVPPYASRPYTELVGEDQFSIMLFALGKKPLQVDASSIKLGDVDLSTFEGQSFELDTGGTDDTGSGITMVKTTFEEAINQVIPGGSEEGHAQHVTADHTDDVTFEIHFPLGLIKFDKNDDGKDPRSVNVQIEYSENAIGPWDLVVARNSEGVVVTNGTGTINYTAQTTAPIRKGYSWTPPFEGQWHIRMRADVVNHDGTGVPIVYTKRFFAILRSHTDDPAIASSDIAQIAIRVKATDQLTGVPDEVNLYAQCIVPDYVPSSTAYRTDFDVDLDGWGANANATVQHNDVDNTLEWATLDADPQLRKNNINDFGFDGSIYTTVTVRMRWVAGTSYNWEGRLWPRTTAQSYTTGEHTKILDPLFVFDEWQVVTWDTSKTLAWTEKEIISGVRFDFVWNSNGNPIFEIDYIDITQVDAWLPAITHNPASLARYVLTDKKVNVRALPFYRLDNKSFSDFWNYCETNRFFYNQNIDFNSTIIQTLNSICRSAFARPMQIDGTWRIFIDEIQPLPLQTFTPRNSSGFSASKVFPEEIHGFRVRFIDDTDRKFVNDEQIVYNANYSESNATKIEALEAIDITDWGHIWKYAKRYLAIGALQLETFVFSTDAEHLVTTVGDRIDYQSDAILVGLGTGRVVAFDTDTVTLDSEVIGDGVSNYGIQFRRIDGTDITHEVETISGGTTLLVFKNRPVGQFDTAPGDLAIFGEWGKISFPMQIKNIEPFADLSAKLTCVPYNEAIYTSDTGVIPPYDPKITIPPGAGSPVITNIVSDEYVMEVDSSGSLQPRMVCTLGFITQRTNVVSVIIQFAIHPISIENDADWVTLGNFSADLGLFIITGVAAGNEVEVRARYTFINGTSSPWSLYFDDDKLTFYHKVIGNTTPPPDVDSIYVTVQPDGTREYHWDWDPLTLLPPDLIGFDIRYYDNDDLTANKVSSCLQDGDNFVLQDGTDFTLQYSEVEPDWDIMTQLNIGVITNEPLEANAPFKGVWHFAIKAVDTAGLRSLNPKYTGLVTLPLPRLADSIFYADHFQNIWFEGQTPGATLSLCSVDPNTGYLIGDSSTTWANAGQWNSGLTWHGNSVAQFTITHDTNLFSFDPGLKKIRIDYDVVIAAGTFTVTYSLNGAAFVAIIAGDVIDNGATDIDTLAFKLVMDNPDNEGIRNWIIAGYPA